MGHDVDQTSQTPLLWEATTPSTLTAISGLLDELGAFLRTSSATDTQRRRTMLAVEELTANAILHGNAHDDICIAGQVVQGEVRVELTYNGLPFDPSDPDAVPERNMDEPGGNGLMLIQVYASKIQYERRNDKNFVCLTFSS